MLHPDSNTHDDARIPRRFARIRDRVSANDREWFERHPGASERYRAYCPGEFFPVLDPLDLVGVPLPRGATLMVCVTQLAPGIRTRRPYAVIPTEVPA